MKIINIIMSLIFSFTLAKAQETKSEIIEFSLPNKFASLNNKDAESYLSKNFKYFSYFNTYNTRTYIKENIFISFKDIFYTNSEALEQTLINQKNAINGMLIDMHRRNEYDKLEIIKVNDISFLIYQKHYNDEYNYQLTSDNKNNKAVQISLQFKLSDKEKADKIFDYLIKSISFKK